MNTHLRWIKCATDYYRTENESKNWITWRWWRKNHQQRCDLRWKYPKDQAMNLCKKSGVGEATAACSLRKSRREQRDGNRHLDELLLWNETHAFLFVMSWMSKKRKRECVLVLLAWVWKFRFSHRFSSEHPGVLLLLPLRNQRLYSFFGFALFLQNKNTSPKQNQVCYVKMK